MPHTYALLFFYAKTGRFEKMRERYSLRGNGYGRILL